MPKESVTEVLDRALLDHEFRETIEANPDVLLEFDLTPHEREVILSRNVATVEEFFPGALYCTIRFALVNENIVAIDPHLEKLHQERLQLIATGIIDTTANRVDNLRGLLRAFRDPEGSPA